MKRGLYVGVRYRRWTYSGYTSTLAATIFVGNLKHNKLGEQLHIDGRLLLTPHLYVAYWPARAGLCELSSGYYVQPERYSLPEGRFKVCFTHLGQALDYGKALMKEALAAQHALHAMGVTG